MKRKILAALAATAALTALTGCTMSDQEIINSFMEPKPITQPTKTHAVEDPSAEAYRKAEKTASSEKALAVKVYGSVRSTTILADGDKSTVQFYPYKNPVNISDSLVITGVVKSKSGGCTILDAAGKILDKQVAYGKNSVFTCIYTK